MYNVHRATVYVCMSVNSHSLSQGLPAAYLGNSPATGPVLYNQPNVKVSALVNVMLVNTIAWTPNLTVTAYDANLKLRIHRVSMAVVCGPRDSGHAPTACLLLLSGYVRMKIQQGGT